jgi:hypothetical protein
MGFGGGGDDHRRDRSVLKKGFEIRESGDLRIPFFEGFQGTLIDVADAVESVKLMKIPDEVLSPISRSDDDDVFGQQSPPYGPRL